jgi:7,8-dihydropterin-6-yl-methyl-4-(beta-D-ribofuranosyl)aminobenzene 5'-phosphate synthase
VTAGLRRATLGAGPPRPAVLMTGGQVPDALIAEHGFSMLVTVTKAGTEHRFLFDAGTSPDGVTENMRRLDIDPSSIEAIVCSHGHFDHTTGLDGLIRVLGPVNMPVLIHPHFWRRRRLQLPGREPRELPTTSRRAGGQGFEPLIPRVLDDLAALNPGVLVPGHCTGWRAQHAMSARFGAAFIPNAVGTSFQL